MVTKQDDIKVVVGAGAFNNNPGWIQTQEDELNLLVVASLMLFSQMKPIKI